MLAHTANNRDRSVHREGTCLKGVKKKRKKREKEILESGTFMPKCSIFFYPSLSISLSFSSSLPPPLPLCLEFTVYTGKRKKITRFSKLVPYSHYREKKNDGFGSVLLTISNYLPVKAKVNKFPHIQQGYITNWTPASSDGE